MGIQPQRRVLTNKTSESPTGRRGKHRLTVTVLFAFLIGLILCIQIKAWSWVVAEGGGQQQNIEGRTLTTTTNKYEKKKQADDILTRPFIPVSTEGLPLYTRVMAREAIRPVPWICGQRQVEEVIVDQLTNVRPIFSFVHVYKAAGSTMRDFFARYSYICQKAWLELISCSNVKSSSIRGDENWKKCKVNNVINGRNSNISIDTVKYPSVNNTLLRENIDIYGGHMQIGNGDFIHGNSDMKNYPTTQPPLVRHIVFLRDPMTRFISGILYQQKTGKIKNDEKDLDLFGTVQLIKKRVRGSRKKNTYWSKSMNYLLTPIQSEDKANLSLSRQIAGMTSEEKRMYVKAMTVIQNLMHYNVIMGMTENMAQSMTILRHVLISGSFSSDDRRKMIDGLFEKHIILKKEDHKQNNNAQSNRINVSVRNGVSTELVLQELMKDEDFLPIFQEYVKYEQIIHEFALKMHMMQYAEAVTYNAKSEQ
jgi:hypothetical protein